MSKPKINFYWTHLCIMWGRFQVWIMWSPHLWGFRTFSDFGAMWGFCVWFLQVARWWKIEMEVGG